MAQVPQVQELRFKTWAEAKDKQIELKNKGYFVCLSEDRELVQRYSVHYWR
jgi:hypothetical protein